MENPPWLFFTYLQDKLEHDYLISYISVYYHNRIQFQHEVIHYDSL